MRFRRTEEKETDEKQHLGRLCLCVNLVCAMPVVQSEQHSDTSTLINHHLLMDPNTHLQQLPTHTRSFIPATAHSQS